MQEALDRLEVCTDDVTGIAWVSCIGLCVEADRAQRARDLREPATGATRWPGRACTPTASPPPPRTADRWSTPG